MATVAHLVPRKRPAFLSDVADTTELKRLEKRRKLVVVAAGLYYIHYRRESKLYAHCTDGPQFDLAEFGSNIRECRETFRFDAEHIVLLAELFGLPQPFRTTNRIVVQREIALSILLWRLRYPSRLGDGVALFKRSQDQLSRIHNEVVNHLMKRYAAGLRGLDQARLTLELLRQFADAIQAKGAALPDCVGFIDGTVRAICRPGRDQRIVYNGHKRVHALKYQAVVTPDGIIAHMAGPFEGRMHDARILNESGLQAPMAVCLHGEHGPYYVYGDPAYGISPHLQSPHKGADLSADEMAFNRSMSPVRESVEWAFGKIVGLFAFVDFKKNQKLGLQQVGSFYLCAALLTNCHTCLYGGLTSDNFAVDPPSIEAYLATLGV
jgi:hypothetical protein